MKYSQVLVVEYDHTLLLSSSSWTRPFWKHQIFMPRSWYGLQDIWTSENTCPVLWSTLTHVKSSKLKYQIANVLPLWREILRSENHSCFSSQQHQQQPIGKNNHGTETLNSKFSSTWFRGLTLPASFAMPLFAVGIPNSVVPASLGPGFNLARAVQNPNKQYA